MRLGWIVACALLEACSPFGGGAFTCSQDSQCMLAGMQGTCQPTTQMCSFSDPNCAPSNQRYGSESGSLAGACVGNGNEPTDAAPIDFPPADTMAALHDATCRIADIDFCSIGLEPAGPLDIGSDTTLNTDTDPRCLSYQQPNSGPAACLLLVSSFAISNGAKLVATGNRPLVIAASGAITISGLLDVSSNNNQRGAGATSTSCNNNATNATNNSDGASGGAGGSFATQGGDSGTGAKGAMAPKKAAAPSKHGDKQAMPTFARGGCKGLDGGNGNLGGAGNAGDAGGSVWLYANQMITVDMTGVIDAGGGGGHGGSSTGGGGGGGTGGFIRLMADNLMVMGTIAANGGGAGQGGKTFALTANDGSSGKASNQAASGGNGGSGFYGSNGGDGGTNNNGTNGADSSVGAGAGGGGGGTGFIELLGQQTLGGTISPPPSLPM